MRVVIVLLICLLVFVTYGTSPAEADSANGVPVKPLILIDEDNPYADSSSELFERVQRVLNVNKIPYDILDISQIDEDTFLGSSSNLRYSVLLIPGSGWKIDSVKNQLILEATNEGMGVVGLAPDSANTDLMPLFGIDELGTTWLSSQGIQIIKDKFTFSYEGQRIDKPFQHIDHHLLDGAEVIAVFSDSGDPAIWTYSYGSGKVVFHNQDSVENHLYSGILLQSILYAMPLGVACPINAGVIDVDDCPRSLYSTEQLQEYYYDYYYNFKEWLQAYNFTASFFIAFSYSGDINDFWANPQGLEWAHDIVQSGYELGLHCGNEHTPLEIAYWGSQAAIDAEVDEMMAAWELLRDRLYDRYGTQLGEAVSYVAPDNEIGDYGYEVLDARTDIKYVGTTGLFDEYRTVREFGWEGDLDIYNLPRTKGGFYGLAQPQYQGYSLGWMALRSVIESGDSYLIFTHPDELDLLDTSVFANPTMPELFEALTVWADYICRHYPFYRWWTSSELGRYLENREGVLDAEWLPEANTLELRLSQPDDVIHIKTQGYLGSISQAGDTVSLTFTSSASDINSEQYDIIHLGNDYFIYPKGSKASMPVKPEVPFSFKHISITTTESNNTEDNNAALPLSTVLCIAIASVMLIGGGVILRRIRRE